MPARNDREALLRVADQLSIELGYAEGEDVPGARSALHEEMSGILSSEDETLVAAMRLSLARIAAALSDGGSSPGAVVATLDGAEMVMRGELLRGNTEELPALVPSFVFLVALSVGDQDRALELSRRASRLVGTPWNDGA